MRLTALRLRAARCQPWHGAVRAVCRGGRAPRALSAPRNQGHGHATALLQRRSHSLLSGRDVRALSSASVPLQQEVACWEANLTGSDDARLRGPRGDWWWTGAAPEALLEPGVPRLHSLPQPLLDDVREGDVQRYFDNTWALTEVLFGALQGEEAFYRPPYHHLRHPLIFYYGHTATFYTNKLRVSGLVGAGLDAYYEEIFEVGVDEMSWDDMSKNAMQWPSVGDVHAYRRATYRLVSDAIARNVSAGGDLRVDAAHPLWALFMSFEHDRIHLETSSVLMRELPERLLRAPEHFPAPHPSVGPRAPEKIHVPGNAEEAFSTPQEHVPTSQVSTPTLRTPRKQALRPQEGVDFPRNEMLRVAGAADGVHIGKEAEFPTFGWDNEYGGREVAVAAFEAATFMVSNGEFFAFVAGGGYREEALWSAEGWAWRRFRNAKWPFHWQQAGPAGSHEYRLRGLFDTTDMPWAHPVSVNRHEAVAFCRWKSANEKSALGSDPGELGSDPGELGPGGGLPLPLRLLTEAEHMLLREPAQRHPLKHAAADPALTYGGSDISAAAGVNLNLAFGSESPVDCHPANANGFHDVTGNAWEWAEDDFNPLPGFQVHALYDDFSTPCFDGAHSMILGGSFMSSGDAGANLHCRYHFRPHFLQHSGFRYVRPSRAEAFAGQGVATKLRADGSVASSGALQTAQGADADADAGADSSSENNSKDREEGQMGKEAEEEAAKKEQEQREAEEGKHKYESAKLVNQYLALHFGQQPSVADATVRAHAGRPDGALDFPARCAAMLREAAEAAGGASVGPGARALDLGCAVGGASFALARDFGTVVGVDYSQAFVAAAAGIRDAPGEPVAFDVRVEGDVVRRDVRVSLDPAVDYSGVSFRQGDACALDEEALVRAAGGRFDAVLLANLLCRLPAPRRCLESLPRLLAPGGVALLVSPFSWMRQYTPKDQWLQGAAAGSDSGSGFFCSDAAGGGSAEGLREAMHELGFEQTLAEDMPLIIREHERLYQYIVPHATVFRRVR